MKAETKKEVHAENPRVAPFEKVEIILRCKNSFVEPDVGDFEENKSDGKNKGGGQMDKHGKCDRKVPESEEEKENTIDLKKFKQKCSITDDTSLDVISRSPMRTQECHHCYKPYEYPHSTSRTFGGVTRVVEAERTDLSSNRNLHSHSQSPNIPFEEGFVNDIDLPDISQWLNLCKRDPKFLSDFVEDCKTELSKKEISNIHHYRSSRSVCSNVSSQFTSPAQSPSEQNLTSPESVTYEENSLYYSKSPVIPSLDSINIRPVEEEKGRSPSGAGDGKISGEMNIVKHLNILPNGGVSGQERSRPPETLPNIGTVMMNLAEDPYESTIDLNQLTNVCDTYSEPCQNPSPLERDSLNEKLDPKAKESAWARISQLNIDLLGRGDKEGDTQLMILLVSEKVTLEYIYVIVERLLKDHPEYLSSRNELNQDALYLAAFKIVWEPLVASYIAEALVRGKQDVNMKYEDGNTLLHCLAKQGDSHVKVLERLVKLRHPNRTPVFDVKKKNNRGFTPLHIACEVHKKEIVHSYQTVRVLLENGADCTAKDYKDENTPIHTLINESCDVELLRIILENVLKFGSKDGPRPTTVANRQGNTALHLACGRNTLTLLHQQELIELLLQHGAMIQLKNINGCVPSVLVDNTRKQEIKSILRSCRQK